MKDFTIEAMMRRLIEAYDFLPTQPFPPLTPVIS
jgi:hypothetical protein